MHRESRLSLSRLVVYGLWCVTPALSRLQAARLWTTWRAGATVLAQRKPTLLLRFIGEFLLRLGARALVGSLLFHEAPRKERCPESTVTAQCAGGLCEQRELVADVAGLGQESGDLQAAFDQLVADCELVVAGHLGGTLDGPDR